MFQVMDWLALQDEEKLPDLKMGDELPILEVRLVHKQARKIHTTMKKIG